MVRLDNNDISYIELMIVDSDSDKQTRDCLGISDDNKLLLVKKIDTNSKNTNYSNHELFLIDDDEYLFCLGIAAKNLYLQKAISKRKIDIEVSYKGRYFRASSSVKYIIHSKECSIFTEDMSFAEKHDFSRVDQFEYEKTVRISECDAVRIIHKDAESEDVLYQQEFSAFAFEGWLDTLT